ncbi:hypothetical protein N0V84_012095 [Fusarium piperis]|uniref:Uncharacterized protein n=1 Tax=Fusarium piperis TaxID=1435070 RepID=A0A9W8W3Z0_9HYPO|nr:hypothetical protein N0V84_012095 [Fusarium piperis]
MPFNIFGRTSGAALPAPLATADPDRLKVLDIVEFYLSPCTLPYPPIVIRTLQAEEQSEFTIQLPKPIDPDIESKELYVKFKKDTSGQTVVYMSMQKPSSTVFALRSRDQLFNWPTKLGAESQWGPMAIMVEDSVEGRWLSMAMHSGFGMDFASWRMERCIKEQGLVGPRVAGMFAAGCESFWSQ